MYAVAVLALAAGALTLGALTSPDPEAVVETSTTTTTTTTTPLDRPIDYGNFTVDQIATGDQLEWRRVGTVRDANWPAGLVSQLGWLYLFTSSQIPPNGQPEALRAFRSIDGFDWEDLGDVISTNGYFTEVAATPFGLMAVESDSDGSVVSWTSTDAVDWKENLVSPSGDGPLLTAANTIGANSSMVVVTGSTYQDAGVLLEERLGDVGLEVDLSSVPWGIEPDPDGGSNVVVYAPLGIPALSVPLSDLDLTESERMLLQNGMGTDQAALAWSTTDGVTWTSSTIEGADWIESITSSPDGSLLAFGFDSAGNELWRSYDGATWEKLAFGLRVRQAVPWRGRLAGLSGSTRPEVLVSQDGEEWTGLGLADYFPSRISWDPQTIAASDTGIAVTVQGRPAEEPSLPSERREPALLERDGFTLTLDFDQGVIRLERGEYNGTWNLWSSSQVRDSIEVDLESRTVTFLDSGLDSGPTPLVTFTFDELDQAEQQYYLETYPMGNASTALAYTGDGSSWSVQDLDKAFGQSMQVVDMAATPFTLVVVAIPTENIIAYPRVELQIWAAPLP